MVRLNLAYQAIIDGREHGASQRSDPTPSVEERVHRASLAAETGDWPAVVQIVETILASEPENLAALLLKTEAGLEQKRWADAARTARQVLRLNPNHLEALLFAAESACGAEEYLLGRAFAATVLQFQPKDSHARELWDDAQYFLTR